MSELVKGKSPFYPGQPVPVELFVGRERQIALIVQRGAAQVANGKPTAFFVQGEYGIGKSSIAGYVLARAEAEHSLHGIYVSLGGARSLNDVGSAVLEGTVRSGALDATKTEKVRNWLAKYIGKQELFGVSLNLAALEADAPQIATPFGMLGFLQEALNRLKDAGAKGLMLVLDEINGITDVPEFAHFVKGVVDANGLAKPPLPLLLMLCGVEERRRDMIRQHQPVERVFDIVDIAPMTQAEMSEFFTKAFESVQMTVDADALWTLCHYSGGFPKIMHVIGDMAYWIDKDGKVDSSDAIRAVLLAADEIGKKYVDQQVYNALQSADYHSILKKIGQMDLSKTTFKKSEVVAQLTEKEAKKLNNFLQKMKRLNVLKAGEVRGDYEFTMRMVRVYMWMKSLAPEEK